MNTLLPKMIPITITRTNGMVHEEYAYPYTLYDNNKNDINLGLYLNTFEQVDEFCKEVSPTGEYKLYKISNNSEFWVIVRFNRIEDAIVAKFKLGK